MLAMYPRLCETEVLFGRFIHSFSFKNIHWALKMLLLLCSLKGVMVDKTDKVAVFSFVGLDKEVGLDGLTVSMSDAQSS